MSNREIAKVGWTVRAVRYIHTLVLFYTLTGFAWPREMGLKIYLYWVPLMLLHWRLNKGACILTNLEYYLVHGTWEMPKQQRDGGFLASLFESLLGKSPSTRTLLIVAYLIPVVLWSIAMYRWFNFS